MIEPATPAETRSSLTDRNLWLLYLAFLVVGFNAAVPMVFGPFFFQGTGIGNQMALAMLFAVPAMMAFLGQNYWGGLFDHSGNYKPFLVSSFIAAAAAFLMLTYVDSGAVLIMLIGAGTFFSVALIPVGQVYATVTYEHDKGRVLGALFAFESLGWGLACLMGATSWAALPSLVFLERLFKVCLGLSIATAVLLQLCFHAARLDNHPPEESRLRAMIAEWSQLYHDRKVLSMAACLSAITCGTFVFLAWYSKYLCDFLGGSKQLLGISLGAGTFIAAISFPLYGLISDRVGRKPLILTATVGYMLLFLSFVFIRDAELLASLYALPIYPAVRVGLNAFLADMTSTSSRGGGLGVLEGAQAISSAVAPVIGGAVVHWFGYAGLPVAACVMMVLTAGLVAKLLGPTAEPAAGCGSDR
jgi:MFS family permease